MIDSILSGILFIGVVNFVILLALGQTVLLRKPLVKNLLAFMISLISFYFPAFLNGTFLEHLPWGIIVVPVWFCVGLFTLSFYDYLYNKKQ